MVAMAVPVMLAQMTATTKADAMRGNNLDRSVKFSTKALVAQPVGTRGLADLTWGFETDDDFAGWWTYDLDADGYAWMVDEEEGHNGPTCLTSASYISGVGALTPDNWLVSPVVPMGGVLKFWAKNQSSYFAEGFEVCIMLTDAEPESVDGFTAVTEYIVPGTSWTEYTVDLSQYAGTGCFAFHHYGTEDEWALYIDDVMIDAPAATLPTDLTAVPGIHDAEISWTAAEDNQGWNLRYRPVIAGSDDNLLWDFEQDTNDNQNIDLTDGWTSLDVDGDGNGWYHLYGSNFANHSGNGHVTSASYMGGALTPDNWLVSPAVKLDGTLSFWACGQDPSYADEVFGVYASTDMSNWEPLAENLMATGVMTEYTFDLSQFEGAEGYVAIRHYNCTDMFRLNVDDIAITYSAPAEWIVVEGVTNPYTIEGLDAETEYEVQVQAVGENGRVTAWTESCLFTTLPEGVQPGGKCAKPEGSFANGVDFHGVLVTLVNNETAEGTELHYNVTLNGEMIIEDAIYDDAFALTQDGDYYIDFWATAPGMEDSSHGGLLFTIDQFTGLSEVAEGKAVAGVRYYNVAGQEMAQPSGLTIMVTTYSDGSTVATKVVK